MPSVTLVPVSAVGSIEAYQHSGSTDVIGDLQGYVTQPRPLIRSTCSGGRAV